MTRVSRERPYAWAIAAVAVLVAGYVALWLGGTTMPAVLLVAGYVVLVPAAIMRAGVPLAAGVVAASGAGAASGSGTTRR